MSSQLSLPHQLTRNVKLVHKVALVVGNQVLILKRSDKAKSRPGKWDLAGGNSEWPHDLSEATLNPHCRDVAREVEEETGLKVGPSHFSFDGLVFFATYFSPEHEIFSVNCGWKATNLTEEDKNKVIISNEHSDYAWITLEQLDQYDFGGPDRDYETRIIKRCLEEKSNAAD
ncbi:MAG: NUDIX domain-containing protein [Patescibacteria group bacterium]|nr:NUDIX domain-containing protein [Patescibacteria group bacterium]